MFVSFIKIYFDISPSLNKIMLSLKNKFSNKLFVGINTGHLGFFTDVSVEEINEFIDLYISKNYIVQSLPILNTKIITEDKEINIYKGITREDIREVARKYLNPNQSLVLDYVPAQNNDKK